MPAGAHKVAFPLMRGANDSDGARVVTEEALERSLTDFFCAVGGC